MEWDDDTEQSQQVEQYFQQNSTRPKKRRASGTQQPATQGPQRSSSRPRGSATEQQQQQRPQHSSRQGSGATGAQAFQSHPQQQAASQPNVQPMDPESGSHSWAAAQQWAQWAQQQDEEDRLHDQQQAAQFEESIQVAHAADEEATAAAAVLAKQARAKKREESRAVWRQNSPTTAQRSLQLLAAPGGQTCSICNSSCAAVRCVLWLFRSWVNCSTAFCAPQAAAAEVRIVPASAGAGHAPLPVGQWHTARLAMPLTTGVYTCTSVRSTLMAAGSSRRMQQQEVGVKACMHMCFALRAACCLAGWMAASLAFWQIGLTCACLLGCYIRPSTASHAPCLLCFLYVPACTAYFTVAPQCAGMGGQCPGRFDVQQAQDTKPLQYICRRKSVILAAQPAGGVVLLVHDVYAPKQGLCTLWHLMAVLYYCNNYILYGSCQHAALLL
jgi:hypothetical protein